MPPRKSRRSSKDDIKAKADRAEGKPSEAREDYDALDPVEVSPPEEVDEVMPGGVTMRVRKGAGGRPPAYKPEYAKIAEAMLILGATVGELAELFGVANTTIWRWQQTYPEFCKAFCNLNEKMDQRVERALHERAVGYTYDAVKIFQYEGNPVIVPHKVHVPPDVGAQRLYLAARKPKEWQVKDGVEVEAGAGFVEVLKQIQDMKKK